jgi:hypothetical protein
MTTAALRTALYVGGDARLLEPGWLCSIVRKQPADGLVVVVCGEVQAVDSYGVRVTGMDWLVGAPRGYDVVVPWAEVAAIFDICTDAHRASDWAATAAATQDRTAAATTEARQ